ncbi:MAG: glycerol kinase, partial [Ramlibacter sp.]|nr:glycerol kinase [Ramlibacter sp.]
VPEARARGAACLAGLACGELSSGDELAALWRAERRFVPTLGRDRAGELMAGWEHAVRQATAA